MKWLEFIRARGATDAGGEEVRVLKAQLQHVSDTLGLQTITLLRHQQYVGDMAVVLSWDNQREPEKTREGYALAKLLGPFGSVEHAVWKVEVENLAADGTPSATEGRA